MIVPMDGMDSVPRHLADNILKIRKAKGLSQEQLAKLARLPRSTLAHIESGVSNPSLMNLSKISSGLQVGIEELLSKPRKETLLIPADQLPIQRRAHGRVRIARLMPEQVKGIEVDRIEFDPLTTLPGYPHMRGSKEYLTVIQGSLAVTVAGEHHIVPKGALFSFSGDQPHSYRNSANSVAIALTVVVPIVFS